MSNYTNPNPQGFPYSTLGGIYLSLKNRWMASATMVYGSEAGYYLRTDGPLSTYYLNVNLTKAYEESFDIILDKCSLSFRDPMQDILDQARVLMLTTVDMANLWALNLAYYDSSEANNYEFVGSQQAPGVTYYGSFYHELQVYKSHYLFLALALGFIVLSTAAVLPLFNGFWALGSYPSMSPKDTAHAFIMANRMEAIKNNPIKRYEMKSVALGTNAQSPQNTAPQVVEREIMPSPLPSPGL